MLLIMRFFQVGTKIFRQVIGIPMGSDPAPFIANLFLYVYQNRFMDKLKRTDLPRARRLRHVFRFIDDLLTMNDNDEFMNSYHEIYPPEMELKLENNDIHSATYLDLDAEIKDRVINTKFFNKSDAFKKLIVVRMPYKCSNIPLKMFYATVSAEILRICRATSNCNFSLDSAQTCLQNAEAGCRCMWY